MTMQKTERDALLKLCRQREKLAKVAVNVLASKRRAEFETQLAKEYSYDDDHIWKQANAFARAALARANKDIAARAQELGIPREFAPSLSTYWNNRGQNESRQRRTELTKVAHAQIEHLEKEAKFQIEQFSVEIQTRLLAGALESTDAKSFLEGMPTAEQLMPAFTLQDIQSKAGLLSDGLDEDEELDEDEDSECN